MFHYTSCGLQNVWLKNGYTEIQTDYGPATSIHDIEGLHKVIGLNLVNTKPKLSGAEVRFLRKELDLPQGQLASLLGVSEVTVRGWENHRTKITKPADKLLRMLYVEHVTGQSRVRGLIDDLAKLNRKVHSIRLEMEETESGWKTAA